METNYDALRMPDLRALEREDGLRGYSRLRKAEMIAFLRDNLRPMSSPRPPSKPMLAPKCPSKPMLAPRSPSNPMPHPRPPSKPMVALRASPKPMRLPPPLRLVKRQPKHLKPPKPMRPSPPHSEDSFNPYEWGQLSGELIRVSELMEGVG